MSDAGASGFVRVVTKCSALTIHNLFGWNLSPTKKCGSTKSCTTIVGKKTTCYLWNMVNKWDYKRTNLGSYMVFTSGGNITMCLVNVISLPGPTLYICHGIGLKDKHAENPSFISWEITSFPVDFPSNQSIGSIVDEYSQFKSCSYVFDGFPPNR